MQLAKKFASSARSQYFARSVGRHLLSARPISTMASRTCAKAFEPDTVAAVSASSTRMQDWEGDLLVVAAYEDDFTTENEITSMKSAALQALDQDFGSALSDIIAAGGFEGKQGSQSKVVRVGSCPGAKAKYVSLAGLGKQEKATATADWGQSSWQALGGSVATLCKANKVKSVAVGFLDAPSVDKSSLMSGFTSGVLLGGYESTAFKTKKSPTASPLETVSLLMADVPEGDASAGIAKGTAIAKGVLLHRYLVEAPPNICTPTLIAEAAKHIADKFPEVMKLEVFEKEECREMGMGCFLGVAEASDEPPKFVHLTYTSPGEGEKKKVAIIGKGVTFDSGGYNIKAGAGSMIELMKFDMGGSGATMGAARIVAELAPPGVEVHFIVAACENMISGRGLRPGDILTAANGKTVEVNNTDAEGRLTLADALWFAQEKAGVSAIVDCATLTGACIVALGHDIAGLMTPSESACEAVTAASKAAGEKVWRLPMEQSYWDQMKSSCADMKNTGARGAGTITAALFLKQFVKDEVEWAHIDMAGPTWDFTANLPTGYGSSTLAHWAIAQGAPKSE